MKYFIVLEQYAESNNNIIFKNILYKFKLRIDPKITYFERANSWAKF